MTNHVIRPTREDDIPMLQEVLNQTELFPSEMLPDLLAPALTGASSDLWLTCCIGGDAIGLCYTAQEALTDGTWNMRALAVHPRFQGNRAGSRLVSAAENTLRQQAQRILIVETSGTEGFALTRRFYANNGYEEEARIRDFWARGDDKVIFRKAL